MIYDRTTLFFFPGMIDEIPEEVYTASKCFHTTGITLALNEDIRETTIEMIKRFKAAGTWYPLMLTSGEICGQGTRPGSVS